MIPGVGNVVGGVVGGAVGLFAPQASYTVGSMGASALFNAAANLGGQIFGAAMADVPCGKSKLDHFQDRFSPLAIVGAGVAGAFTPLCNKLGDVVYKAYKLLNISVLNHKNFVRIGKKNSEKLISN